MINLKDQNLKFRYLVTFNCSHDTNQNDFRQLKTKRIFRFPQFIRVKRDNGENSETQPVLHCLTFAPLLKSFFFILWYHKKWFKKWRTLLFLSWYPGVIHLLGVGLCCSQSLIKFNFFSLEAIFYGWILWSSYKKLLLICFLIFFSPFFSLHWRLEFIHPVAKITHTPSEEMVVFKIINKGKKTEYFVLIIIIIKYNYFRKEDYI